MSHGVPLVMYGQDVQPCDIVMDPDGSVRVRGRAAHWHEYRDYIRYPFGLEDGPALEVLQAAAASEEPIRDFRDRFMGEPMDGAAFVDLLERLCGVQPGPAYDGRRATSVLALAPEIADGARPARPLRRHDRRRTTTARWCCWPRRSTTRRSRASRRRSSAPA